MITYILQRLTVGLLVALTVSVITFSLTNLAVDPAVVLAGATASHQDIEAIRSLYGFDQHIVIRYLNWLSAALTGDLGISFRTHLPVFDLIMDRLPVTLILGVSSLILAIVVSLPLAILAALNPNTWIDKACLTLAVFGQALPAFWFGLLMIVLFSVNLGWLPASGSGSWKHYVMPSIALGYYAMPALMRLTRTGLLDVLSADYIRTARAKGLMPVTVIFKHALRNAILPIISLAGGAIRHDAGWFYCDRIGICPTRRWIACLGINHAGGLPCDAGDRSYRFSSICYFCINSRLHQCGT